MGDPSMTQNQSMQNKQNTNKKQQNSTCIAILHLEFIERYSCSIFILLKGHLLMQDVLAALNIHCKPYTVFFSLIGLFSL